MRTTVTIDEAVYAELKETAHRQRQPLTQVMNRALQLGLQSMKRSPRKGRIRTPEFRMGTPLVGNLDKALALASILEDEEILRKLALRK
jgi:hypothetical protein